MNPFQPQARFTGTSLSPERTELVQRYQRLRDVCRRLSSTLVQRVIKRGLEEAGKKLGLLRKKTLVVDSESEMAILMDYLVYDVRRNGRNAIDDHLRKSPPAAGTDAMICLQATQGAYYSLFAVDSLERDVGVTVRDLQSSESKFVIDYGFSRSALPGLVLAMRLLPFDDYLMTSGAALPLGVVAADQRDELARKLFALMTIRDGRIADPAPLIRSLLQAGRSANIGYEDIARKSGGPHFP